MAIASYDTGDRVRLGNHSGDPDTGAITDVGGAPADPTDITLAVRAPDGSSTTYTYGGTPALLREGVGRYYVDVTVDQAGLWAYRLVGTGAVVLTEEGLLHVRGSALLDRGASSGGGGTPPASGSYYTAAESDARFLTVDEGDDAYAGLDHSHPQVTTGEYHFQTNPAMTDPGSGNFRSNTGAAATATQLSMDQLGAGGTDITTLFNAMRLNDTIFVQDKNDALQWVRYQLTGTPTINTGWAQVPVSVISSGGTIAGTQLCVMQLTLTAGGGGGGGGMDAEAVMDLLGTTGLVEGAGIDLVYNDAAGTLTITADKTEMSLVPGDVGLGNVTNVAQAPATRLLSGTAPVRIDGGASGNLTADRTISVVTFSGTTPGVVPDGSAAGATTYLNGDGAWTIPASAAGGARLTQIFTVPGPLAPAVGTSEFLVTLPGDIVNVWASLTAVGSGASVLVDVNLNGVTIFTTQSNRPSIAAGSQRDTTGTPDAAAADFVAGDRITVDVDQVGTHAAGVQLTIGVEYTYD